MRQKEVNRAQVLDLLEANRINQSEAAKKWGSQSVKSNVSLSVTALRAAWPGQQEAWAGIKPAAG